MQVDNYAGVGELIESCLSKCTEAWVKRYARSSTVEDALASEVLQIEATSQLLSGGRIIITVAVTGRRHGSDESWYFRGDRLFRGMWVIRYDTL